MIYGDPTTIGRPRQRGVAIGISKKFGACGCIPHMHPVPAKARGSNALAIGRPGNSFHASSMATIDELAHKIPSLSMLEITFWSDLDA